VLGDVKLQRSPLQNSNFTITHCQNEPSWRGTIVYVINKYWLGKSDNGLPLPSAEWDATAGVTRVDKLDNERYITHSLNADLDRLKVVVTGGPRLPIVANFVGPTLLPFPSPPSPSLNLSFLSPCRLPPLKYKSNLVHFSLKIWHLVAPILLIFSENQLTTVYAFFSNYIKLKVYGQTVWLDGGTTVLPPGSATGRSDLHNKRSRLSNWQALMGKPVSSSTLEPRFSWTTWWMLPVCCRMSAIEGISRQMQCLWDWCSSVVGRCRAYVCVKSDLFATDCKWTHIKA